MQVEVSTDSMRQQALSLLQSFKASKKGNRQRLDFIMLAVRGKKVGFDKIIKMIDVMVALLKEEQVDDDSKKEYCEMSLDKADDMKYWCVPSASLTRPLTRPRRPSQP